jgi:hypothetical protein
MTAKEWFATEPEKFKKYNNFLQLNEKKQLNLPELIENIC